MVKETKSIKKNNGKLRRYLFRVIGVIVLVPVFLILMLSILLYVPTIQNFAVKKITQYASSATDMSISIEYIRLDFPLTLTVNGIEAITSAADTILYLNSLSVDVKPLSLISSQELEINILELKDGIFNSHELIDGMTVKGRLGNLSASADIINLTNEFANLRNLELSQADIHLIITDTTTVEDSTAVVNWKIMAEKASLKDIYFTMDTPADSSGLSLYIGDGFASKLSADLGSSRYGVDAFMLDGSSFRYDANGNLPAKGFDADHIALSNVSIHLDSIMNCGLETKLIIGNITARERSGLEISSFSGNVVIDSANINISQFSLQTPNSNINLHTFIPWAALEKENQEEEMLSISINANIRKKDVLLFAGYDEHSDFAKEYPVEPFVLSANVKGNMSSLDIKEVKAELPNAFFFNTNGYITDAMDNISRSANILLSAETKDVGFILNLLPQKDYALPSKLTLDTEISIKDRQYNANALLTDSSGKVSITAFYDLKTEDYYAKLDIDSLQPVHFMPKDSLLWLTANIEAKGKGADIFSGQTWAEVSGNITNIIYGSSSVSDVAISGSLKENEYNIGLKSKYPTAKMDVSLSGTLKKDFASAMLIADVDSFNLQSFNLTKDPYSTSFQLFTEASSNFDKEHSIDVTLGNWEIHTPERNIKSNTLTLHLRSDPDTSRVSFHTGDLGITLEGRADLGTLSDKLTEVKDAALLQIEKDSMLSLQNLKPMFPELQFTINANKNNPIYNISKDYNLHFSGIRVKATTSPETGLRFDTGAYMVMRDSILIDTVRTSVYQDSLGLIYKAEAIKNKYLRQEAYKGHISGKVRKDYINADFHYENQNGEKGLELGIRAEKVDSGYRISMLPEQIIFAFHPFSLNKDNYIHIKSPQDISADLKLTGENNASLWIHSIMDQNTNDNALHVELSHLDLGLTSQGFAFIPEMGGVLSADFQYAPMDSSYMLVADMNVKDFSYQKGAVGDLTLNAVYLPLDDNNSQTDIHFFRNQSEITTLTALASYGEKSHIDGNINVNALPLDMITPFIPDNMANLNGALQGNLSISGNADNVMLDGFLRVDSGTVYVGATSTEYKFDGKEITLKDNLLSFDKYKIYASGNNPFIIDGFINMSDPMKMVADIKMTANNMELLNARKTKESLVYGKVNVNLNSTLKGPLDALRMQGDLRILGTTDVAYVMTESQLTVQDRLAGLVTFVSFEDTIFNRNRRRPPLHIGGMNTLMTIKIDPAVQFKVDLSADQSNYVEIEGGGDLAFQYTAQGDMILNGRYTMTGGSMKYRLPIVSTKNFTIKNGSYVEWRGNVMNPYMDITATERIRTSVSLDGQNARPINFDAGVRINQTLENMALDFTLDAPEDMSMHTELVRLGADERRKRAITLMVAGIYTLGGEGGKGLSMNSALSNFLSGEINNIAGSALKGVDLSVGLEDSNDMGSGGTDFTFRFAKRFYNDRIRIVIGGRLSSGNDAMQSNRGDTFIDNVSVEYKLNTSGNHFVKLFHSKNYESLLEGEITETGAGLVLKRKMLSVYELFNLRKKKIKPITEKEMEDIE